MFGFFFRGEVWLLITPSLIEAEGISDTVTYGMRPGCTSLERYPLVKIVKYLCGNFLRGNNRAATCEM